MFGHKSTQPRYKTLVKTVGNGRAKSLIKKGWVVTHSNQAFLGPQRVTLQKVVKR